MNYIFGGNTLYPRGSRGGSTSSAHGGSSGPKLRQWSIRSSSEETAKPTPSRWRRVLATLTHLNTFSDCIIPSTSQVSSASSCRGATGHRHQMLSFNPYASMTSYLFQINMLRMCVSVSASTLPCVFFNIQLS